MLLPQPFQPLIQLLSFSPFVPPMWSGCLGPGCPTFTITLFPALPHLLPSPMSSVPSRAPSPFIPICSRGHTLPPRHSKGPQLPFLSPVTSALPGQHMNNAHWHFLYRLRRVQEEDLSRQGGSKIAGSEAGLGLSPEAGARALGCGHLGHISWVSHEVSSLSGLQGHCHLHPSPGSCISFTSWPHPHPATQAGRWGSPVLFFPTLVHQQVLPSWLQTCLLNLSLSLHLCCCCQHLEWLSWCLCFHAWPPKINPEGSGPSEFSLSVNQVQSASCSEPSGASHALRTIPVTASMALVILTPGASVSQPWVPNPNPTQHPQAFLPLAHSCSSFRSGSCCPLQRGLS